MRITEDNRLQIRKSFDEIRTAEDLLALLNEVKVILLEENAKPFDMRQLNYHSNPKLNPQRYVQFFVPKKSGGMRIIHAPSQGLKMMQTCLNVIFQAVYTPHKAAMGFVPEKSVVDNAKIHAGSNYVYNIDLKDFFPSIDQARVWKRLQYSPFNFTGERQKLANMIAAICCHSMEVERKDENGNFQKVIKNVLPQGAPTSPTLTNVICERLDYLLTGLAKRFGLKYSRYADDMTFSSMHNVYQKDGEFLKELHRIVAEQNFCINEKKTRLQKQGYRQEVTGLVVNEKANVTKRYVKQIRMWLYYWEQYGYDSAFSYFCPQYKADKGHVKKGQPSMENVISGKLEYLKMVKGKENSTYLKLNERFERLSSQSNTPTFISSVLDIWEKEGIEKAMEVYYGANASENEGLSGKQKEDKVRIIQTLSLDELKQRLDIDKIGVFKGKTKIFFKANDKYIGYVSPKLGTDIDIIAQQIKNNETIFYLCQFKDSQNNDWSDDVYILGKKRIYHE